MKIKEPIRTFDICLHKPSRKYYFVRYCRPDYSLENYKGGYKENKEETNWWLWSVMPDKVGGVYAGDCMKFIATRMTLKWFIYLIRIIK